MAVRLNVRIRLQIPHSYRDLCIILIRHFSWFSCANRNRSSILFSGLYSCITLFRSIMELIFSLCFQGSLLVLCWELSLSTWPIDSMSQIGTSVSGFLVASGFLGTQWNTASETLGVSEVIGASEIIGAIGIIGASEQWSCLRQWSTLRQWNTLCQWIIRQWSTNSLVSYWALSELAGLICVFVTLSMRVFFYGNFNPFLQSCRTGLPDRWRVILGLLLWAIRCWSVLRNGKP